MARNRKVKISDAQLQRVLNNRLSPESRPTPLLRAEAQVVGIQQSEQYSGPLPRPSDFEAYDRIYPGCAEAIVAEMRAQAHHRRRLEHFALVSDVIRAQIGQFMGFLLAGYMIWQGAQLLMAGKDATGFGAIGTGIAAIIAPFIIKTVSERKERQENRERSKKKGYPD